MLLEPLCFSAQSGEPSTIPDPGVILEIERSICLLCDLFEIIHTTEPATSATPQLGSLLNTHINIKTLLGPEIFVYSLLH